MASHPPAGWREAPAYDWLLEQDRAGWAWEWLRRDELYRCEALEAASRRSRTKRLEAEPAARPWGLHRFEDPRLDACRARPMWIASAWPATLRVKAAQTGGAAGFAIRRPVPRATMVAGPGNREHWLVAEHGRMLRIDVLGGTLARGTADLWLELCSPPALDAAIASLRQLAALWRGRGLPAREDLSPARVKRLVRLLRVADAIRAGAPQREIAAVMFGGVTDVPHWRAERPTLRLQVQRLVRNARLMADGGYRRILSGTF